MNLLQGLYCSNVFIGYEVAFHEGVCLLLALAIYCVVTICEPVKECVCSIVWIVLGEDFHTFIVKSISSSFLSVRSLKFEVVSDTHELNSICIQFLLQSTPIVSSLDIVIFFIDCTDDVNRRKPPLGICLIPNGPDLAVVEESDGDLTHAFKLYII